MGSISSQGAGAAVIPFEEPIQAAARELFALLERRRIRLAAAESCTGGGFASALVGVPGVSQWFCGSAVTYRDDTKHRWLGVRAADLANPAITAVSETVARAMAAGVLERTPEADCALATTGHLGPAAPPGQDGLVYLGFASRMSGGVEVRVMRHQLQEPPPHSAGDAEGRQRRQREAVLAALQFVCGILRR
jgi:PncC family amidohydrolase